MEDRSAVTIGASGGARPLLFHHVPKTGGTSFVNRMRSLVPSGSLRSGLDNRLDIALAERLAAEDLPPGTLIHAHPDWGACRPLLACVDACTLVRDPARQIVSHYLHALRDPTMPQHAAVHALGFRDYLRTFRFNLAFQTLALYSGIADPAEERRRALARPSGGSAFRMERYFVRMLDRVLEYVEDMPVVGVTEDLDGFVAMVAEFRGWPLTGRSAARDNAAGEDQARGVPLLLEQLADVTASAEAAALFAIEQALHARARALGEGRQPRISLADTSLLYRSSEGEVFAGANLQLPLDAGEACHRLPAWTGPAGVSVLWLRPGAGVLRLHLQLGALVHVRRDEIHVALGDEWLKLDISSAPGGAVWLTIDLAPLSGRLGQPCELKLYLERNGYPAVAPFYPKVRIDRATLARA